MINKSVLFRLVRIATALLLVVHFSRIGADVLISLYLRSYLGEGQSCPTQEFLDSLDDPRALSTEALRVLCEQQIASGIFALYGGNATTSDLVGHIVFPLRHTGDKLSVLITEKIFPVMMFFNTIHHWELDPEVPAQHYAYTKVHHEGDDSYYWDVEEIPLPADHVVPHTTLVILGNPQDITVPLGTFPTPKTPHMLLPDMEVRRAVKKVPSALYLLTLKHFFGSIDSIKKLDKGHYLHQRGR